jgi:vanillate O-demethylase monooxygenase subunit
MGDIPDGVKVDRWQITHFGPPSFVKLDIGSAPVGTGARRGERSKGVNMWQLNAITPESAKRAHYFWALAWNFKLEERWLADMLKQQLHTIFLDDQAIIKAQQENMDLGAAPAVSLGQDKAWVAMRGIVQRLVEGEKEVGTLS